MNKEIDWTTATPLERIIAISEFENNWDGYGTPIPTQLIHDSLVLLCCIYTECCSQHRNDINIFISPSADPSILFDLKCNDNEIQIWVEYNDELTDVVYNYFNPLTYNSYDFELDKLSEIINEL